jgi:sugar lactone lactonase YvrE
VDLASGVLEPFAGSGREGTKDERLANAELAQPSGLALDGEGRLYFADSENRGIRKSGNQEERQSCFLIPRPLITEEGFLA